MFTSHWAKVFALRFILGSVVFTYTCSMAFVYSALELFYPFLHIITADNTFLIRLPHNSMSRLNEILVNCLESIKLSKPILSDINRSFLNELLLLFLLKALDCLNDQPWIQGVNHIHKVSFIYK